MGNYTLQRNDPFTESVTDACSILAVWKNRYGDSESRLKEANDSVTFTTTGGKMKGQ